MLFNSFPFIFYFLPIAFAGFFLAARYSSALAAVWLAAASVVFYGQWDVRFVPLLLGSTAMNYIFGKLLAKRYTDGKKKPNGRQALLAGAVLTNLAVLGFFKYADFFIDNINVMLPGAQRLAVLHIVLPIGISFYTFTQIAFLVDCYQGKASEPNPTHYLLFVTYFPHLIAGPILHHSEMMPQFARKETYRLNWGKLAVGLAVFVIGLSKKLLLADPLGERADSFFNGINQGTIPLFGESWLGTLAYTFQIYFDFSGYSDMAIGLSLLFGIALPLNFASPYKATSIIDFWRRWHMTLSRFLRDYLYFPLGGNRRGTVRRYVNLLVTMLLGGLWHGASWTFVLWGAAHGVLLAVNHFWRSFVGAIGWPRGIVRGGKILSWSTTFICVCLTWVLFRADSIVSAITIYKGLLGFNGGFAVETEVQSLILLGVAGAIALGARNTQQHFCLEERPQADNPPRWQPTLNWLIIAILLFALSIVRLNQPSPFLYFQF